MDRKTIAHITGYLMLCIMAVAAIAYLLGEHDTAWPYIMAFVVAAWMHGICWGYLYALKGRLTWF